VRWGACGAPMGAVPPPGCPDDLFEELGRSRAARAIRTLKEIDIAFLPYESQVFSLDSPQSFHGCYSPQREGTRAQHLGVLAEQLATLCATLGEFPAVRYRRGPEDTAVLARALLAHLDARRAQHPAMVEGRAQLLIVDRAFDLVTPLLHELTLQAMAYDLLGLQHDTFRGSQGSGEHGWGAPLGGGHPVPNVPMSPSVPMSPLSPMSPTSPTRPRVPQATLKELSHILKKMPQYQKELSKYATHLSLADACMRRFKGTVERLCAVEQGTPRGHRGPCARRGPRGTRRCARPQPCDARTAVGTMG
uniref:Uncharacterized protein n=1 Tax=Cairina moschata TaxID=8855 RepID=A0A8C3BKS6_CAIMO